MQTRIHNTVCKFSFIPWSLFFPLIFSFTVFDLQCFILLYNICVCHLFNQEISKQKWEVIRKAGKVKCRYFPLREIYLSLTNHPGQLSLATPSWVGAVSTGQRTVMLCEWGVKADMVLFAGNTVWSLSECVRGVCVNALYKSTFTYLLYYLMHKEDMSFKCICLGKMACH